MNTCETNAQAPHIVDSGITPRTPFFAAGIDPILDWEFLLLSQGLTRFLLSPPHP